MTPAEPALAGEPAAARATSETVALLGQPNVGKSTVFNILTGLRQHVGNWPGKTVTRKEGRLALPEGQARLIDLPGTYSLTAGSEEERIVRGFLLHDDPDVVIFLADATALERGLYLLAEVLALHRRVVVGLNRMDVARQRGVDVDADALAATLGVPVVPMVARNAVGVDRLLSEAEAVRRDPGRCNPEPPAMTGHAAQVLNRLTERLAPTLPGSYPPAWVAQKLLEGDGEACALVRDSLGPQAWESLEQELRAHEDLVLDVLGARYTWVERAVRTAVHRPAPGRVSWTDRLDRVATHGLWGFVLLFAVLGAALALTFEIALPLQGWLDAHMVQPAANATHAALDAAPRWLGGLLADGVITGVGTVLTFLPVLALFYVFMGVLEDSGYLARVALVMDRFMHAIGLHGKSALPLTLGFGCNVISVMNARIIDTRAGRLMTILLAPLVPCSARLAVLAVLTPAFFGAWASVAMVALIALNMLVLAGLGLALHRTTFRGEESAFVMELPLYQRPNLRSTLMYVYTNLKAFVRNAGTVIVLASVAVWALSSFPGPGIENSALAQFGRLIAPVGDLMGFDWRLVAALLSSFVAKEVAISTLGILYGTGAGTGGLTAALPAAVGPAAGLAFLAVTMLFIPCLATVAVMRQEAGWRWTLVSVGILLAVSLVAGIGLYQGGVLLGLGDAP